MIKIIGLLENTKDINNKDIKSKHGLSIYIETNNHKILFDVSPNKLFIDNAKKLGIDLTTIDMVVISHDHVDHLGGLKYFLNINKTAKIYISKEAINKHYVKVMGMPINVGINKKLLNSDRFILSDEKYQIDDNLLLFSKVKGNYPLPKSNSNLYMRFNNKIIHDDFLHEQNLIIKYDDKTYLFCGCAHTGIINIVNKAKEILDNYPNYVFGGFHLYEPIKKVYENKDYINNIISSLKDINSIFYTCHCTGIKVYNNMKKELENKINYLHTGTKIEII